MLLRPTRVHEKFGGFHSSAHGCAKNAPDFTIPNRDTPKTHPVLHLNHRRRTFRGVCNTPLHGYMKNLTSFIFPYLNTSKTRPILPFPIGIRPKPTQFHILPPRYAKILLDFRPKPLARNISGRMLLRPTRVHEKFGGFHIPAHDIAQNPAGFGLCHTTWRKTRRVLDFATRHSAKPGGFWTLPLDIA